MINKNWGKSLIMLLKRNQTKILSHPEQMRVQEKFCIFSEVIWHMEYSNTVFTLDLMFIMVFQIVKER